MFLGFYNCYSHFVRQFANIAAPLYALLCKEITWYWTDTEKSAMHSLCTALCRHPVLALLDYIKPFCIESGASDTATGGELTQEHGSFHKTIAFFSRTLTSSERNFSVPDHELLSIVTYCKAWRLHIDRQ